MLKFVKWVFPIIVEFIKSNNRVKIYLKRNLNIILLAFALLLSLVFNIYLFEQATVYGAYAKDRANMIKLCEDKIQSCANETNRLRNPLNNPEE